jgi:hypothetical protein
MCLRIVPITLTVRKVCHQIFLGNLHHGFYFHDLVFHGRYVHEAFFLRHAYGGFYDDHREQRNSPLRHHQCQQIVDLQQIVEVRKCQWNFKQ